MEIAIHAHAFCDLIAVRFDAGVYANVPVSGVPYGFSVLLLFPVSALPFASCKNHLEEKGTSNG